MATAQRVTVTKYRFNKSGGGFIPTAMTVTVHDVVTIADDRVPVPEKNTESAEETESA